MVRGADPLRLSGGHAEKDVRAIAGTSALRLRTNQEIYWDRVAVAFPETSLRMHEYRLPMASARLRLVGFPARVDGLQRYPRFDYDRRRPFSDTRSMAGFFTKYGPVEELLRKVNGAMAIFGAGEEIHVEFTAPGERPRRVAALCGPGDPRLDQGSGSVYQGWRNGGAASRKREAFRATGGIACPLQHSVIWACAM
uniref:Uncharacterized protein n=1 Tax=Candidatus Kentrum sp. SD TaxID=2126332 RepID=A0A451BQL4_9GAMM|nr:MAG: hypothetical protein BECKSD772D_GA0070982_11279 [Candidatus Kentron sp. SD]